MPFDEATLVDGLPEIPYRMNPQRLDWFCDLDNYEPVARRTARGRATGYFHIEPDGTLGERRLRLESGAFELAEATKSLYLIDDGHSVEPMYVIGWHLGGPSPAFENGHDAYIIVAPMPTNYTKSGQRRMRADRNEPVDFSGWTLGPRRAYHLKVKLAE